MPKRKSILTDELATQLFYSDLFVDAAARQAQCRMSTLRDRWVQLFGADAVDKRRKRNWAACKTGDHNPMAGKFGADHPNYKGAVSDGKGYVLVLKPTWFTGRRGSRHVFEHHVRYCEAHGITEIPAGHHVHHKDGDKTNNTPENLELLSASDHMTLHHGVSPRRNYHRQLRASKRK